MAARMAFATPGYGISRQKAGSSDGGMAFSKTPVEHAGESMYKRFMPRHGYPNDWYMSQVGLLHAKARIAGLTATRGGFLEGIYDKALEPLGFFFFLYFTFYPYFNVTVNIKK